MPKKIKPGIRKDSMKDSNNSNTNSNTTISGIPEERIASIANKVEQDIDDGYRILMEEWNKPVKYTIDGADLLILRPNTRQIAQLMVLLNKISDYPKDAKDIPKWLDTIRDNSSDILPELIVSPKQFNTKEFWSKGDYPFDFLVRIVNAIMNIFNQGITKVESFQ